MSSANLPTARFSHKRNEKGESKLCGYNSISGAAARDTLSNNYGWSTLVSSACSCWSDLQVEDGVLGCVAAWMGGKVRRIRVRVDGNEEEIGTC